MKRISTAVLGSVAVLIGALAFSSTQASATTPPPGACTLAVATPAKIVLGAPSQAYSLPISGCEGVSWSATIDVIGNGNSVVDTLLYSDTRRSDTLNLYPALNGAETLHLQLASFFGYAPTTCTDEFIGSYACNQDYTASLAPAAIDARYRSASTLNGHRVGNTTTLTGQILQYSPPNYGLVAYRAAVRVERWNGHGWQVIGIAYPNGKGQFSYTRVDAAHYHYRVETFASRTVWDGTSRPLSF